MTKRGGNAGQEWFSVAEIAALNLPGLPATKRGVQAVADREGWAARACPTRGRLARRRTGRGGGLEYHLSLLPKEVAAKLASRSASTVAADNPASRESAWARFDRLPEPLKIEARRRLEVIQRVELLVKGGVRKTSAVEMVAAEAARASDCSTSTIYGWLRRIRGAALADRLAYLAPDYVGRIETAECHPDVWRIFKSDYLRPNRSFAAAYRLASAEAAKHGWAIPSSKTLRRRLEREVDRTTLVAHRAGPDALRRELPWIERDETTFHALEAVNVDGHKWDAVVDFGDGGAPDRPMMVAIQDVYSRKILAWRIGRTENVTAVRLAFADLFRRYGIPRLCFFDNGRAFASKWMTGGAPKRYRGVIKDEDPVGLLTQFGVEVHFTTPYSGQSKPIERSFRDLEGEIGTSAALSGAYVGNNPLNKPHTAGTVVVPLKRFEEIVAAGIAAHNARPGRRTKACAGKLSFAEVFQESYERSLITQPTPEQLRQALLGVQGVRVRRNGHGISILGNRYWGDVLLNLVGQRVAVRFDPEDLHQPVSIYSLTGVYLGDAECLEKVGFANAKQGQDHQRLKRRLEKQIKAKAAAEKELLDHELATLGPEFPDEEEALRPAVVRGVFNGSAALQLVADRDPTAAELEAELHQFNRAVHHLRVVGEDE